MSIFLSVVVPAYNEEENISNTLEKIYSFLTSQDYSWEIIVVDDGSLDRTVPLIREFQQDHSNLSLICSTHKGKASAVLQGLHSSTGDYVLFTDADLSTSIDQLRRLLIWVTDHSYQIVIASREGIGAKREGEPWYRHIMGRFFNLWVRVFLHIPFNDTQCGFKLFTRKAVISILPKLKLYSLSSKQIKTARVTAFDTEILFLATKLNLPVKELSVPWKYIKTTRVNCWRDSLLMAKEILKIRWWDLTGKYNLYEENT